MTDGRRPARRAATVAISLVAGALCACTASFATYDDLPVADDSLVERWQDARERLLDDYGDGLSPRRVPLGRRASAEIGVHVEPGWCYALFAVAEVEIQDLDLVATRPNGRVVGRDEMLDASPMILHCSDYDEVLTVEVQVSRGRGDAAFGVLQKPD